MKTNGLEPDDTFTFTFTNTKYSTLPKLDPSMEKACLHKDLY